MMKVPEDTPDGSIRASCDGGWLTVDVRRDGKWVCVIDEKVGENTWTCITPAGVEMCIQEGGIKEVER